MDRAGKKTGRKLVQGSVGRGVSDNISMIIVAGIVQPCNGHQFRALPGAPFRVIEIIPGKNKTRSWDITSVLVAVDLSLLLFPSGQKNSREITEANGGLQCLGNSSVVI